MSGYQPFETLRAIVVSGPPPMPVVDRALIRPEEPASASHAVTTTAQVARMRELRALGVSSRQIGLEIGVSHPTVLRHTKDVPPPAGGWQTGARPSVVRKPFAERLRRSGFTYAEIAAEFGCAESAVWHRLNGKHPEPAPRRRVHRLVQKVSHVTGVPASELRSHQGRRAKTGERVSRARHILFWLLQRHYAPISLPQIAASLGGFNHTSCLYGIRRVNALILQQSIVVSDDATITARLLWAADWSPPRQMRRP